MATYKSVEDAYKKKNAAVDQTVAVTAAEYEAQRDDLRTDTQSTLQQIYTQRARDEAMLGQQNRAAGITGGAAESSRVAIDNNYNTNRTNALIARDRQISALNIAEGRARADAQVQKAQNAVDLETGRLSFNQDESTQRRSELWELVKAGAITPAIAKELGWSEGVLRQVYNRYKEA